MSIVSLEKSVTTVDELEALYAEIRQPDNSIRLHEVERDIIEGLHERPLKHWCKGCHRLFRTIHAKALGRNWRRQK
jgi:hypothetical protein